MTMGFKAHSLPLFSLALALVPGATCFRAAASSTLRVPSPQTSTTLHYRDDVPPIGSAPKWETPNDFDQFLTQCTIQSFTFLLQSLRDEHTVRWLDDFTGPVMEKHTTPPASNATLSSRPAKVSLGEAAQSALRQTERALTEGTAIVPPNKSPAPHAQLTLLNAKIAVQTAFASFSKAKKRSGGRSTVKEPTKEDGPKRPAAPFLSTDVSQLYTSSGIPQQSNPPIIQKKWAPLGKDNDTPPPIQSRYSPFGKKPQAVSPSPLAAPESPSDQNDGTGEKKSLSPFGNIPAPGRVKKSRSPFGNIPSPGQGTKYAGRFAPVPSTSPLYGGGGSTEESNECKAENIPEMEAVHQKKRPPQRETSTSSVLKYHGLGILNNTRFPTSGAYFEKLLDRPKALLLVQSPLPHVPDIELDIDPASLCRRMISVRSQIAREFGHDLQVIADMGGLTLKSYHKMLHEIRERRAEEKLQRQRDDLENLMPKSMEDSIGNNDGAKSRGDDGVDSKKPIRPQMQRANLLFLDRGVGEGDAADYAPSPLRRGNFDLLCLLATQEAIHRVLNDPTRQARTSPEHGGNQFLQDFYITRLLSHFSGDQRYGRADDFLEELLDCAPRMITIGNNNDDENRPEGDHHEDSLTKNVTYLVDPVKVAEIILNEREVVALQWKQHLSEQTMADHMAIQKRVLAKVMEETVGECEIVDPKGNTIDFESCFE